MYLVLRELPLHELLELWRELRISFLFIASLLFLLSQVLSALRLNLFFHQKGFNLEFMSNLKLYFLGMFYNFFIPGGVGGDAYKVYRLKKNFNWNVKELSLGVLLDRGIGFLAILVLGGLIGAYLLPTYSIPILACVFLGLVLSRFLFAKWFSSFKPLFWKTFAVSLGVQLLQVLSFICLLEAINAVGNPFSYALLFLGSSVLSLISFAGIGAREMLFMLAATHLNFDAQYSVSASLLFTIITAVFSLIGLYFQFRVINLKTTQSS